MDTKIKKEEIEAILGCNLTQKQFDEALQYAERKQAYIYSQEYRPVVLQRWYLVKLTEEYVRSLAFSNFTMDLCKILQNMEKEHSVKIPERPTDNHIVAENAL